MRTPPFLRRSQRQYVAFPSLKQLWPSKLSGGVRFQPCYTKKPCLSVGGCQGLLPTGQSPSLAINGHAGDGERVCLLLGFCSSRGSFARYGGRDAAVCARLRGEYSDRRIGKRRSVGRR